MKVNDIITEGWWDTVKAAGRGAGNLVGSAATGAIRVLDKAAGGTGMVGTQAQQAAYAAKQQQKAKAYVDRVMGDMGRRAMIEFSNVLRANNFDVQQLDALDAGIQEQLKQYLKAWTDNFFGDHNYRNVETLIKNELAVLPLPVTLSVTNIQDYINKAADVRKNIESNTLANTLAQQAAAAKSKAATNAAGRPGGPGASQQNALASGVTVVSSANPLVLRYRNRDYALTDDDRWVYLGSDKSPSAEMIQFLNKQLQQL